MNLNSLYAYLSRLYSISSKFGYFWLQEQNIQWRFFSFWFSPTPPTPPAPPSPLPKNIRTHPPPPPPRKKNPDIFLAAHTRKKIPGSSFGFFLHEIFCPHHLKKYPDRPPTPPPPPPEKNQIFFWRAHARIQPKITNFRAYRIQPTEIGIQPFEIHEFSMIFWIKFTNAARLKVFFTFTKQRES